MMATYIILCACMYPFIFLMYFLIKNEGKPRQNTFYGVELNEEQRKQVKIDEVTAEYNRGMRGIMWFMLLFPLPMLLIPWMSIAICYWMIWILLSCFIFFVPFAKANVKLKQWKKEKGLVVEQEQVYYAEMKYAGELRKVKWFHWLPPIMVSVGLVVISMTRQGRGMALQIAEWSMLLVVILIWVIAIWMDSQKNQVVSHDSDINVNYNRARKNLFKNFWLIFSWVNVAYMVLLLGSIDSYGVFTQIFWIATIAYMVLSVIIIIWLMKQINSINKAYQVYEGRALDDNEDNWIWGFIYYNPRDKHTMVSKRYGMGTTVNLATIGGTIYWGIGVLVLVITLPLMGIWLIALEFTPIRLQVDNRELIAHHLREEYSLMVAGMDEVELITELPSMSRESGTGMETLRKGYWYVSKQGPCEVFLNPQNDLFIKIVMGDKVYYFSGYDNEETQGVYDELRGVSK